MGPKVSSPRKAVRSQSYSGSRKIQIGLFRKPEQFDLLANTFSLHCSKESSGKMGFEKGGENLAHNKSESLKGTKEITYLVPGQDSECVVAVRREEYFFTPFTCAHIDSNIIPAERRLSWGF